MFLGALPRLSLSRLSFTFLSASVSLTFIMFYLCLVPPKLLYGQHLFLVTSY